MTADRALPAAVVERCVIAGAANKDYQYTAAALAEFLAILDERGLRVVPVEITIEMALGLGNYGFQIRDDWTTCVDPDAGWTAALAAAPPLAELLEDRDAD